MQRADVGDFLGAGGVDRTLEHIGHVAHRLRIQSQRQPAQQRLRVGEEAAEIAGERAVALHAQRRPFTQSRMNPQTVRMSSSVSVRAEGNHRPL